VNSGDYVYIEAGTMHAMAAGSFVFEIEENCNATYRVYDFNRVDSKGQKRQLHTENALKAIEVDKKPIAQKYNEEKVERLYSTKLFKNC
jgi:mannose-6-phosphate isomerase